ncbi:MAG: 30S ribosomal protein S10 [Candidatus Pacebacteria bacterium]|jgi:small subunit ribosomal protein S10|nr:30S ribosomal protein S10 [Candidatus Paceibacterota bacterium]
MPKATSKTENKVRIRFKSYDHRLLDRYLKEIVSLLSKEGIPIKGPIPLPTEYRRYTVNRSPFIYKDSREQFEIVIHKRIIDILNPSQRVLELLNSLDLPAGIEVEIKLL